MSKSYLASYLNDHLAGSVVGLQLIEHLEKVHAGSPLAQTLAGIRAEIEVDRDELETLIKRHDITPSMPRKAIGWLSEKLAEMKLRMDDAAGGPLHLLEAVEAVSIGIHGKLALWRALQAAGTPGLTAASLQRLIDRAQDQRERMETLRLEAARTALQTSEKT